MPRVTVTGGSGKLGRFAVAELLAHGWQVVNLDRVPPAEQLPDEEFVRIEFTDCGQAVDTLPSRDKARRVLGYQPAHSWREEVGR